RTERVDVCIIGSGAGGSVMAHEAARRGLSTLVVERGPYVRGRQMSHDEYEMIPRLYKDGGLQFNTSMDLYILQGSCVGGSTVLSNMVLLRPSPKVFDAWRALGAEFDERELLACFDKIEKNLEAAPAKKANVSTSTKLFVEGAKKEGLDVREMTKALGDCVGCGECNIGCVYDTKRSALTTYIPWAEEKGARVLADTEVVRIKHKSGRVTSIEAKHTRTDEPLEIIAKQVIVACGAIGSSGVLLKSGLDKNVGTRVSFNAGSMITAEFDRPIDAFDADQMTTYVPGHDFLIEATHYPLLSAALTTPGWMKDHGDLMKNWRNLAYAGALVATEPVGRVVHSLFFGHEETRYHPTAGDVARLKSGLKAISRAFFSAGAKRVVLPTHKLHAMSSIRDLDMVDRSFEKAKQVCFGTSHPQGGNPWSSDPGVGAVGRDFALHGFENLFVCDASLFPTPIGVNPISTIMALAEYAAPRVYARA
ncbi:MAG TPA: GMC family oxidoreductase, partial [Minicystis sp.]|nr:GMC family oxidoreductase [Minicystis sp.]